MNPEILLPFLKQAVGNAVRTGATQMLEDMAETFSAEDLGKLIAVLQRVEKKKRGTIDAKGDPSVR